MHNNATTTGPDTQLLSLLGSILELAARQDGTMDTACQSLFAIEDLAKTTISRCCRRGVSHEGGYDVCMGCRGVQY